MTTLQDVQIRVYWAFEGFSCKVPRAMYMQAIFWTRLGKLFLWCLNFIGRQ